MQFPKLDKCSLTEGWELPPMYRVKQLYPDVDLSDPVSELKAQLLAGGAILP